MHNIVMPLICFNALNTYLSVLNLHSVLGATVGSVSGVLLILVGVIILIAGIWYHYNRSSHKGI